MESDVMERESSPADRCSGKPRPEGGEGTARWQNGASAGWVCVCEEKREGQKQVQWVRSTQRWSHGPKISWGLGGAGQISQSPRGPAASTPVCPKPKDDLFSSPKTGRAETCWFLAEGPLGAPRTQGRWGSPTTEPGDPHNCTVWV